MVQKLMVVEQVLSANDRVAENNRQYFDRHAVFAINILASPGAGKTSLIEKTVQLLAARLRIAVIDGDIATSLDADRAAAAGASAVQINTGGECHLDAPMIAGALPQSVLSASVPEGDDKPYKYPGTYRGVNALVINKIDLLPYVTFNMDYFRQGVEILNPGLVTFPLSCRTDEGLDSWIHWLLQATLQFQEQSR
jgi:hydrogenase nickel incorporation protein HypB